MKRFIQSSILLAGVVMMYSGVMLSFSPESIVSRIADKVQAEVTFFEDEAGSVLDGDTNFGFEDADSKRWFGPNQNTLDSIPNTNDYTKALVKISRAGAVSPTIPVVRTLPVNSSDSH